MKFFPEDISTYGQEIDNLFYFIFLFVAIAFVISVFVLIYPLIANRAGKNKKASYITGEKRGHFAWITRALVLLALSDFVILFAEHKAWDTVENIPKMEDLRVGVTGRQWNWIFTYPGPDGKLNTSDDLVVDSLNSELHVPVHSNVVVELRAIDVLHSFFVPNARLKHDCIPGRMTTKWFNLTRTGRYDIVCAEICGTLHGNMRNFLRVESRADYDAYVKALAERSGKK